MRKPEVYFEVTVRPDDMVVERYFIGLKIKKMIFNKKIDIMETDDFNKALYFSSDLINLINKYE